MLPVAPMARTISMALGAATEVPVPADISVFEVRAIGDAAWNYGFSTSEPTVPVTANTERQIPLQIRSGQPDGHGDRLLVSGTGTLVIAFYGQPKN